MFISVNDWQSSPQDFWVELIQPPPTNTVWWPYKAQDQLASQSLPDITQQQLLAGVVSLCQATPDRTSSSMPSQNSLVPKHVPVPTYGQEAGQPYQKRV